MHRILLKPKPPYKITLHLEKFTIPGHPTPCIYGENCCRRIVDEIAYTVCVYGEPDKSVIEVIVDSGDTIRAREIIEHIYNTRLDYSLFLEKLKKYKKLYSIALEYRGFGKDYYITESTTKDSFKDNS